MEADRRARRWFALTAFVVLVGLVVQVILAVQAAPAVFHGAWARALNVFAFFTILSNLIVGVTSLLLVLNLRRSSTVFSVFRLTGIVAIAITGIVFHVALAQTLDLAGWNLFADRILHLVVPVMAVGLWLLYGPRGIASSRIATLTVIFPAAWLILSLVRGAVDGFYPYHFIDVNVLGYGKTLINCVWVAALYLGVAYGAAALDQHLPRHDAWL